MKTAKELLVEAQEYLSDVTHIVKNPNHLFETPEGVDITLTRREYVADLPEGNCRVCLVGAISRFTVDNGGTLWRDSQAYSTAQDYLELALVEHHFNVWKDATLSNHTQMLKIYARAIELAENPPEEK